MTADDPAGCGAQTVRTPCWALHVRHTGIAVIDTRRTCEETEAWGGSGLPDGPGGGPRSGGARTQAELSDSGISPLRRYTHLDWLGSLG